MSTEGAASPDRLAHLAASIRRRIARVVHEATDADREFRTRAPSALELRGMGDLVHDFYTGLERVFEKVSSEFDGGVPAGRAWHRDLLDAMALEIVRRRPALLRQETPGSSMSSCVFATSSGTSMDTSCSGHGFIPCSRKCRGRGEKSRRISKHSRRSSSESLRLGPDCCDRRGLALIECFSADSAARHIQRRRYIPHLLHQSDRIARYPHESMVLVETSGRLVDRVHHDDSRCGDFASRHRPGERIP
jgi:hypothetical protein